MNRRLILFLVLAIFPPLLLAHKPSDSYLMIQQSGDRWKIFLDIALRDLENAIGLDVNRDRQLTRAEVERASEQITAYVLSRLAVTTAEKPCTVSTNGFEIRRRDNDPYFALSLSARCVANEKAELRYNLFFDLDPIHAALVQLQAGDHSQTHALSNDNRHLILVAKHSNVAGVLADFFREGVWHIWIGFDHILFLITLLLPAVLAVSSNRWIAARRFNIALFDVIKIVSAFTLAHSVTLVLAALQIVTLPSRFVESAIALSVLITAINNVWPVMSASRWQLAFGFGLIHGFGFANVLQELDLPAGQLALSLLGFNIGVEAGQLAIVCVFFPLAWILRRSLFYRWGIVHAGSLAAGGVAVVWLSDRLFDQNFSGALMNIIAGLRVVPV